jgi:hypothetical protein
MASHEFPQWKLKTYGHKLTRESCHSPPDMVKWIGIRSKNPLETKGIKCTYSKVLRIRVTHTMIPKLITSWRKIHFYYRTRPR